MWEDLELLGIISLSVVFLSLRCYSDIAGCFNQKNTFVLCSLKILGQICQNQSSVCDQNDQSPC